jgi:hypothetical protein
VCRRRQRYDGYARHLLINFHTGSPDSAKCWRFYRDRMPGQDSNATERRAFLGTCIGEAEPRRKRATMTLRTANRDLQRTVAETAERLSELQDKIDQLENKIAAIGSAGDPDRPADDVSGRSDHDHGDAVPPGVAVSEPEPPGEEDRPVLEHPDRELGSD